MSTIKDRAALIAWAANAFGFSTRYDAADVTSMLTEAEGFDPPEKAHAYVAVIDNNPKGEDVSVTRDEIDRQLRKRGWIFVASGGAGALKGQDEPYTRCTIFEVHKREVEAAAGVVRGVAVELGLAGNGINF